MCFMGFCALRIATLYELHHFPCTDILGLGHVGTGDPIICCYNLRHF